MKYSKNY